jgi:hypothetical protein
MEGTGLYGDEPPTVWMRALRDTKYDGRNIPAGAPYLVHEHMVETVESLGLARREPPPPKPARRQVEP